MTPIKELGFQYSGFQTEEGETMSGGANEDPEKFIEFIIKEIAKWIRTGIKSNPNKTFSFVLVTTDGTKLK